MSKLVMGARLFVALPEWPKWTTSTKVAAMFGVTKRSAQRHLRTLEAAGLAFCDWDGPTEAPKPARWWRA